MKSCFINNEVYEILNGVELFCCDNENLEDNWIDDVEDEEWDIYDNRKDDTSMGDRIKRGW